MKIAWMYSTVSTNKYIGGNCLRKSICPALRHLGHDVVEVENYKSTSKLDADIIISTDIGIDPSKLPSSCVKIIWNIDDPECPVTQKWDIILTNSYEMIPHYKYKFETNNVAWLTFAFDSLLHEPIKSNNKEWDFMYIGNGIESKSYDIILESATDCGNSLAIFGTEWDKPNNIKYQQYLKGSADYTQLPSYYSKARIALNMHRSTQQQHSCSYIMKDFEILGCGAMCISDWFNGWERYFADYMVTSKTSLETRELMKYYLSHPEKCEEMGMRAQKYILKNHTYIHRAKELVELVETLI